MGSKASKISKKPTAHVVRTKVVSPSRLLDEKVGSGEGKIEQLAEKLVADGTAANIVEAQEMVLRDPAHADIRREYEGKFN